MRIKFPFRRYFIVFSCCLFLAVFSTSVFSQEVGKEESWPPSLKGATNGTVTLTSELFLKIPDNVKTAVENNKAVAFTVATIAPTVDLAFHGSLPNMALNGTGWSCWGDIAVAQSGKAYCGIGDHGDDAGGKSYAYIYEWDMEKKILKQVVDVNAIVPRKSGESSWAKVHARIDEGPDGKIYFTGTLNDGNAANQPKYKWSKEIPGGQLYRYDPVTGKAEVFANLPNARASATSILDRKRNVWWCNLEAGGNALIAINLDSGDVFYKAADGSTGFNRNFALANDGCVYFNGPDNFIWKCDAAAKTITQTKSVFKDSVGMRSSTRESSEGYIYGVTHAPGRMFRYSPSKDELVMLGPDFLEGEYTTVCVMSPDEKFVYYLPGAHGSALNIGTPVIQYRIATGERKVIAFLRSAFEKNYDYVPGGTYGVKISADGSTLYVNLNGHASDAVRPAKMTASGFGLTAFTAIHIPESERK